MTETMLERCARAIYEERRRREDDFYDDIFDHQREPWREAARAALQAIREPDEAMTKYCAWDGIDVGEWQSGIDAILSQSQEGK
jgi:hypothetical protein